MRLCTVQGGAGIQWHNDEHMSAEVFYATMARLILVCPMARGCMLHGQPWVRKVVAGTQQTSAATKIYVPSPAAHAELFIMYMSE